MGITEEHLKRITEQAAVIKALDEKYVDVSGELEALASDNAAMEAEIRGLEEANARLRERLNRGENHDAYMKLPLDGDGVPIRIGDTVWYVGCDVDIPKDSPLKVAGFVTMYGASEIFIETQERPTVAIRPKWLTHRQPEPPDSWEQLEEDMMRGATCAYFRSDKATANCFDCLHGAEQSGTPCWKNERLDILKRAKKLAGIEEEAQR